MAKIASVASRIGKVGKGKPFSNPRRRLPITDEKYDRVRESANRSGRTFRLRVKDENGRLRTVDTVRAPSQRWGIVKLIIRNKALLGRLSRLFGRQYHQLIAIDQI